MVRSIGNQPPMPPEDFGHVHNTLIPQMKSMIEKYRCELCAEEFCPSKENTERLCEFTYKLRAFLEDHKKEIFAAAQKQGWPAFSTGMNDGYEGIYDALMVGLNTIVDPEKRGIGSVEFVNEQLTQLTWLMGTPNNKK